MPIRVLLVDDSALMRRALTLLLSSDPEIEVVGTARDGRAAIEQVATLRPDVITMDVRMPVMDGLETTEHIMAYYPTPILVLTASLSRFDIDITFKMLGLGALDVMEKPSSDEPGGLQEARAELIRRIKMLSRVRVVTHLRGRRRETAGAGLPPGTDDAVQRVRRQRGSRPLAGTDTLKRSRIGSKPLISTETMRRGQGSKLLGSALGEAQPTAVSSQPSSHALRRVDGAKLPSMPPTAARPEPPRTSLGAAGQLVVIGASTGGPRAVQQILRELPPTLPGAVLVVQHIADGFTQGLVDWLASSCQVPVQLAQPGMLALPGHVYVAPDNLHLLVDRDGVLGLAAQPALLQRPSVDVTMQRAAEAYGSNTLGVLLTGMGRDGASGMAAIHHVGGRTIAQSRETCIVYGMPRAAIESGVVDEVLAPELVAGRLMLLLKAGASKERR